jgi:hypothetical protein
VRSRPAARFCNGLLHSKATQRCAALLQRQAEALPSCQEGGVFLEYGDLETAPRQRQRLQR